MFGGTKTQNVYRNKLKIGIKEIKMFGLTKIQSVWWTKTLNV